MLTERQDQILDFVKEHATPPRRAALHPPDRPAARRQSGHHHGPPPRPREQEAARKLADGKWGLKAAGVQTHLFAASVYGSIPAGLPAMQEQIPDEAVLVDPALFGVRRARAHHFWLLRVRGDSMVDANIFDGDPRRP